MTSEWVESVRGVVSMMTHWSINHCVELVDVGEEGFFDVQEKVNMRIGGSKR